MMDIRKALCAGIVALLWSLPAGADGSTPAGTSNWSGSFLARLEALALLQTLNADLLSNDSATLTLEHWCELHRLASPPRIVAERVPGTDKLPSPEQRRELGVTPTEPVRYRRVRLLCGAVVLSEADNWYVPGRLTPEMNRQLDATDTPFGKVVQALQFRRRTLSSTVLVATAARGVGNECRRRQRRRACRAHAAEGFGTSGASELARRHPVQRSRRILHRQRSCLPGAAALKGHIVQPMSNSAGDGFDGC